MRMRTVRGRLTAATVLVVGIVTITASLGLYTTSRRALVGDVRETLSDNLAEARDVLDRGVATELNLLALGIATDPLEQTSRLANSSCAPILAEAYGDTSLPFDDYYFLIGIDDATYVRYNDCIVATDPYFAASFTCDEEAIAAIGNPRVTFDEFQDLSTGGAFDAARDACLEESLLVDSQIAAATEVCDIIIVDAFDGVDVLDDEQVATRTEAALGEYGACMRDNGVPDYPDISSTSTDDFSVLSGIGGSAVLIPSLDSVRAGIDRFGFGLAIGVPALLMFLGALAWVVVGRALAPVEAIRSRVAEISTHDLDLRVPAPGTDDEVARLADTMNAMLERLEQSTRRQRQFVSDASHELRSPLASIHTQLEVALAHPESTDWAIVGSGVLAEGLRMERLVGDLLALARADEGALAARVEPVDLSGIAREEARSITTVAVDTSAISPAVVHGDPLALRRVIRNLLDNSARHARRHVSISIRPNAAGIVVMSMDDDGAGISEADRQRVFERVTRLEDARQRDAGGAGLGLAVVEEIVRAHGGSIEVTTNEHGGARFTVTIPTATPKT